MDGDLEVLRRRVTAAVRRACPRWLGEQAEDLVQTVLSQLVGGGEGDRQFTSIYLEKAAYGATVDEIRRRVRRREEFVGGEEAWSGRPSADPGPERGAAGKELARAIRECLSRLVPPRRIAVVLHLQGCSVPETADRLAANEKRAENLVYRGMADLRHCLTSKGFTP